MAARLSRPTQVSVLTGSMKFGSTARISAAIAAIAAFACGGRADRDLLYEQRGGSGGAAGAGKGGAEVLGGAGAGLLGTAGAAGKPSPGDGGRTGTSGAGGVSGTGGGASAGGSSGVDGSGGTGTSGASGTGGSSNPPDVLALLGDYDVFVEPPPSVEGCTADWYEARLNLSVEQTDETELRAQAFVDFEWSAYGRDAPGLDANTLVLPAVKNWDESLAVPALELSRTEQGLSPSGFAEIPYTCDEGPAVIRRVAVTVAADTTPPKLRVEPLSWGPVFAFTHFGFTFSEPLLLPSGDYYSWFEEPEDAAQVAQFFDVETGLTLATTFQWSLAGPLQVANFLDPEGVEGRTVSLRILESVADRAGNPVIASEQLFEVLPAAPLGTEIDFDGGTQPGIYGNATYHAESGPGAACEQGGCLVLDGPVPVCDATGPPASMFAIRAAANWDTGHELRYRVWASTYAVTSLMVGFASGCLGEYSSSLSLLAEPDGPFTHASPWQDRPIGLCGGPNRENGFVLALGCWPGAEPPEVRVVIERIRRLPD